MKFGQTQQMSACSKSTIETLEKGVNDETNVFLVSLLLTFEHFSHIFLVFPLLALSRQMFAGKLTVMLVIFIIG